MIGVDTNILVRYVVQDDPVQSRKAETLLESATPEKPFFVNAVTLAELVWVLEKVYRYTREDIYSVLGKLLFANELKFEHPDAAHYALRNYRQGKVDFADYFLGRINKMSGCKTTKTFDKKAAASDDFTAL